MHTRTPPSAAVREPDLSPVARMLPALPDSALVWRWVIAGPVDDQVTGGHEGPAAFGQLAGDDHRARHGPRAWPRRSSRRTRSPRGCARTCSRRRCGWAKRCASSKPSRTCHRRLGSIDERPSVGGPGVPAPGDQLRRARRCGRRQVRSHRRTQVIRRPTRRRTDQPHPRRFIASRRGRLLAVSGERSPPIRTIGWSADCDLVVAQPFD